jgi:hypothetical protein
MASADHAIRAAASIKFALIILSICAFPDTGDRLSVKRAPEIFASSHQSAQKLRI